MLLQLLKHSRFSLSLSCAYLQVGEIIFCHNWAQSIYYAHIFSTEEDHNAFAKLISHFEVGMQLPEGWDAVKRCACTKSCLTLSRPVSPGRGVIKKKEEVLGVFHFLLKDR